MVVTAGPFLNLENQRSITKAWQATVGKNTSNSLPQPDPEPEPQSSVQTQRRLDQDKIQALARDYITGMTINALAAKWNIHRTTVMDHLKRQGVQTRRGTRKLTTQQVYEAAVLYRSGHTLAALGRQYNVQPETIRRALTAAGVTIRPKDTRKRGQRSPDRRR